MSEDRSLDNPRKAKKAVYGPDTMEGRAFALFDTILGQCGIVWGARGVAGVTLPEARGLQTRARAIERFACASEGQPPPGVQRAISGIVALLQGEESDLSGVALDMDGVPPFHCRVYGVARTISPGSTLSYGAIAARLGSQNASRAVGQALRRNPFAIVVPCHRVLGSDGRIGGFSANGGTATKIRLLSIESDRANGARPMFDGDGAFDFDPSVAVEHLRACDVELARVVDAVGPFRMKLAKTPSIFVALAEAIVYQQLTAKAAATIFARLRALFPRGHEGPTAEQVQRVSDERLRSAGVSRSKCLALRDLARKVANGEIPALADMGRMEDEAIIERLTKVRGIGRWTVEMLLMFRLGRRDVFPVDDYGIRKAFAITFRKSALPSRADLEKRGARWKPYRTVASWYLWRALDGEKT